MKIIKSGAMPGFSFFFQLGRRVQQVKGGTESRVGNSYPILCSFSAHHMDGRERGACRRQSKQNIGYIQYICFKYFLRWNEHEVRPCSFGHLQELGKLGWWVTSALLTFLWAWWLVLKTIFQNWGSNGGALELLVNYLKSAVLFRIFNEPN